MRHRQLPRLLTLSPPAGVSDAELLSRWVAYRDEVAFELLVRRHGPKILAACRRQLADSNDADDVFQATFLILARKAASVAQGEALSAWLHRVAYRAVLRVRAERSRRTERQEPAAVEQLPSPHAPDPACADLLRVLDEEIERLPARHRAAFILCCLEGKTGEEAGRILGCPPGTVSSRLTRARERLRDRLSRRGLGPAAVLLLTLSHDRFALAVPNSLVGAVLRDASLFHATCSNPPPPGRPAAIAQGVMRTMFAQKLNLIPLLLLAGLLAAGAALADTSPRQDPRPPTPLAATPPPVARAADEKAPRPPVVRLVKPQPGGLEGDAIQTGVAEAGRRTDLFSATTGVVIKVNAGLGDPVKAGQVLAEVDAPMLLLDERLATVSVAQAEGLLKEAEARVATASAEVAAAKETVKLREAEVIHTKATASFREKQLERMKTLANEKAVDAKLVDEAQQQYEAARGQAEAAVASVGIAKTDLLVKESKLKQAQAGVPTAKANVEVAKIGLEKARVAMSTQLRITAPFEGVVAAQHVAVGDYVRTGEKTPLFTIMQANALRVVVGVPERDVARVKPGVPAQIVFDALPNVTLTGKLTRVGVAVEPKDRTVRVEIALPNPKGEVLPGMTGQITLKLGKGPADALRVPVSAVFRTVGQASDQPTLAVYVYKNGKARLTPVGINYINGGQAEIRSGLTADDLVVTDPKALIPRPEVEVEVEKPAPPK